jgi:hypothetical protein
MLLQVARMKDLGKGVEVYAVSLLDSQAMFIAAKRPELYSSVR